MKAKVKAYFSYVVILFLLATAIYVWTLYFRTPDNDFHIIALDVGQGDSILIQKGDYQILIDGGPDDKVIEKLGNFMPINDREIEMVILTHPHADHLNGLLTVLDRYKVDQIRMTKKTHTSVAYKEFLTKIKEKNILVKTPQAGENEVLSFGAKMIFLWPDQNFDVENEENLNNTSLVFRLDYYQTSALFPGDLETDGWQKIIAENKTEISDVSILKVAHHGSKNGTTKQMIEIIKPKYAIISLSADNKFGFPHKNAIDLLQNIGASIFRTDTMSDIDLRISQNGIITKDN